MSEKELKDLTDAFALIENHDLQVETMICSTCGAVVSVHDKSTKPCEHLKKLVSDCLDWKDERLQKRHKNSA